MTWWGWLKLDWIKKLGLVRRETNPRFHGRSSSEIRARLRRERGHPGLARDSGRRLPAA